MEVSSNKSSLSEKSTMESKEEDVKKVASVSTGSDTLSPGEKKEKKPTVRSKYDGMSAEQVLEQKALIKKQWQAANADKMKQYRKTYYEKNKQKIIENQRLKNLGFNADEIKLIASGNYAPLEGKKLGRSDDTLQIEDSPENEPVAPTPTIEVEAPKQTKTTKTKKRSVTPTPPASPKFLKLLSKRAKLNADCDDEVPSIKPKKSKKVCVLEQEDDDSTAKPFKKRSMRSMLENKRE